MYDALKGRDYPLLQGIFLITSVAVVGANFVLIYTYLGALYDPDTSGGVVLVLTILAWVNIVARALFYVECWIVETNPPDDRLAAPGSDPAGDAAQRAAVPST